MYTSVSLALLGNNKLISILIIPSSIEFFLDSTFYYNHPIIKKIFENNKAYFQTYNSVISTVASYKAGDSYKKYESLIEEETIMNCKVNVYTGFLPMLSLSSVIKREINLCYPDHGSQKYKSIFFYQHILPLGN